MTRRDWWLGVALVAGGLVFHAACPRYEFQTFGPLNADVLKVDRWTGEHQHMWIVGRGPDSLAPGPLQ